MNFCAVFCVFLTCTVSVPFVEPLYSTARISSFVPGTDLNAVSCRTGEGGSPRFCWRGARSASAVPNMETRRRRKEIARIVPLRRAGEGNDLAKRAEVRVGVIVHDHERAVLEVEVAFAVVLHDLQEAHAVAHRA